MTVYDLVYLKVERNENGDGCIARLASRAKGDVLKRILRKGKAMHKHIYSRYGLRTEEEKGKKNKFVPKHMFNTSFIRATRKEQNEELQTQRGKLTSNRNRPEEHEGGSVQAALADRLRLGQVRKFSYIC